MSTRVKSVQDQVASPHWSRGLIDVHHHFYPPAFAKLWKESPEGVADTTLPHTLSWTPSWMIEICDQCGIDVAVLSNNDRPFTRKLSVEARSRLFRECNEYGAKLGQDYPGRVKLFASLPMPDVDQSLEAIRYALDDLKAVGIHMMTCYGNTWPGDPKYRAVLEELNRRKAIVFCHPRVPDALQNLMGFGDAMGGVIEYPYDTGRAIMSLLMTGSFADFPDIRWIFCHTGAVIIVLASRISFALRQQYGDEHVNKVAPKGVDHELKKLYWDTAGLPSPENVAAFLTYMPQTQLLYGSDHPLVWATTNRNHLDKVKLSPTQWRDIERNNAKALVPEFAGLP